MEWKILVLSVAAQRILCCLLRFQCTFRNNFIATLESIFYTAFYSTAVMSTFGRLHPHVVYRDAKSDRYGRYIWAIFSKAVLIPWAIEAQRNCELCVFWSVFCEIFSADIRVPNTQSGHLYYTNTIPDICHFLYTTAFVRPVKSPPKSA